jgi:hypothetical protein
MKIEKVIFTIDDNPHYKGFWSSISKHFKERMDMTPKLFVIGSNKTVMDYDTRYGEVEFIEKLPDFPTIIQALIGKFYLTKTEPETTWMIGDLDLYPLQKYHFIDNIKEIDDDSYVHLNPHCYGKDWRNSVNGLAGYFHVAKGKIFESELNFGNKTFSEVCREISSSNKWGIKFHNFHARDESKQASSDYGWFCCEEMYTGDLLKASSNLIEIPPKNTEYPRIDRSNMIYDENLIGQGFYIDFHAPRPYEQYADKIESIASKI